MLEARFLVPTIGQLNGFAESHGLKCAVQKICKRTLKIVKQRKVEMIS